MNIVVFDLVVIAPIPNGKMGRVVDVVVPDNLSDSDQIHSGCVGSIAARKIPDFAIFDQMSGGCQGGRSPPESKTPPAPQPTNSQFFTALFRPPSIRIP